MSMLRDYLQWSSDMPPNTPTLVVMQRMLVSLQSNVRSIDGLPFRSLEATDTAVGSLYKKGAKFNFVFLFLRRPRPQKFVDKRP